jgi:hypothetical protein
MAPGLSESSPEEPAADFDAGLGIPSELTACALDDQPDALDVTAERACLRQPPRRMISIVLEPDRSRRVAGARPSVRATTAPATAQPAAPIDLQPALSRIVWYANQ